MIKIYDDKGRLDRIELSKGEKYDLCKRNLKSIKEQKSSGKSTGV